MHGRQSHDYYRRERSRDKGYRGRENSEERDQSDRRRYRDHGGDSYHREGSRDYSNHRSRSGSNDRQRGYYSNSGHSHSHSYHSRSQVDYQFPRNHQTDFNQAYQQKQAEQMQHKLRMAIRNNQIQFDPKLLQILRNLPTNKQEELTEQAHSHEKISECILVRELFISGLAQMNEPFISNIMRQYGEIEKIQIIKNFAYVKFNRVQDASNACAEYHNINMRIHNTHNSNFKIFFADHVKRWNVVSNNIQYQNQEDLVPVIYASIHNQKPFNTIQFLRGVFEKFGYVRNIEVKLNEIQGPKVYKSYVLVEYETLTQALRARERIKLNRQKYLGDRKSQVTLLIDSDKITRSCPNVKNQLRYQRKRQITNASNQVHQNMGMQQNVINPYIQQHLPSNMAPLSQNQQHTNSNFYDQGISMGNQLQNPPIQGDNNDIFAMIREFAQKDDLDRNDEQNQSDWVGFLTRNKQFKVEVDLKLIHKVPFELQSILNVSHRADLTQAITRQDYVVAGKFRAANSLNITAFNQYIKYFIKKNRAGIIQSKNYLIYLVPHMQNLSMPYAIKDDEILALFYKLE